MPLPEAEPFRARPLSKEEVTEREAVRHARSRVYRKMDRILPADSQKRFWTRVIESPKAIYRVDGQAIGESTRVWLERNPRHPDGAVSVMKDKVIDGKATPKQEFFALNRDGNLHGTEGTEVWDYSPGQHLDLMNGTEAVLEDIEIETARVATQDIPAVEAPVEPVLAQHSRIFARMVPSRFH